MHENCNECTHRYPTNMLLCSLEATLDLLYLLARNLVGAVGIILCELPRPWPDGAGHGRGSWRGWMVLE